MKRTISILVIIAMMLSTVLAIVPVSAAEAAGEGTTTPVGTAVATADEFKAAVEANKDFYLTADITLPLIWAAKDFGATFDGNGKTVTFTGTQGLFGKIKDATIKNVTFKGDVELTSGIALNGEGANRFENVTVEVKAINNNNGAAFIAQTSSNVTFVNCVNKATIKGGLTGGAFGGWYQGSGKIVFENCANYGDVTAQYAGGYIGASQCGEVIVTKSVNGTADKYVNIASTAAYGGGMFGENFAAMTLTEVNNYANVTGGGGVIGGGILAAHHSAKNFTATKVVNYGAMDVDGAWNKMGGGFVGDCTDAKASFFFTDCINNGTMKKGGNNNGGGFLAGNQNTPKYKKVSFIRCTNNCDIEKGGNVGGFMGQSGAEEYYFEDCVNNGDITSTGNTAGGFFGWGAGGGNATLVRCTNNGIITANASGKTAGGFIACRSVVLKATDCVNTGKVNATGGYACGIASDIAAAPVLDVCVNKGEIVGKDAANSFALTNRTDEVVNNGYMTVAPTATVLGGAVNVTFNSVNAEGKDYIALVAEGAAEATVKVYSKDVKTGFNILETAKDLKAGYYTVYFVANDGDLAKVIAGEVATYGKTNIFLSDGIINTVEDFLAMKEGGIYALGADIVLPEGYEPINFAAYLAGNGKSITVANNKPVFNVLKNATIKDLTIKGAINAGTNNSSALATTAEGNVLIDNVTVALSSIKGSEIAGFIQYVAGKEGTTVTIKNSKNNAALTGYKKTAGFIAYVDSKPVIVIDNCVNNGAITRVCVQETQCNNDSCCGYNSGAGFIANTDVGSNVTIKNSTNNGKVYGSANVAGFTGYTFGTITLENCVNNGYIELTNTSTWAVSAAGFVSMFGNNNSKHVLTMKGCTNNADVQVANAAYEGAGCMVGSAKWVTTTEIYFEDCVNKGDLYHKSAAGNYGGFLGWASSIHTISLKNCVNYGNVESGTGNNGGFLGQIGVRKALYVENCVNYGDVTSVNNTAGALSAWCNNSSDATVVVKGFTNYGTITAVANAASACMISNDNAVSFVFEDITNYGYINAATDAAVAIAWFSASKATFTNIVNNGKLNGTKYVGEGEEYYTNNGTKGEKIEIYNAEDFKNIKPGFSYILMANIVLPEDYVGGNFGSEWYTCELDGNGKTIYMKGLKSPLFDKIHNANIYNFNIVGVVSAPAAIAREISNYAAELIVTDVVVDVDINYKGNAGGFFAIAEEQKAADLTDTEVRNIAFTNCAFLGNITTTGGSRTGGFGGCWELDNGTVTFTNCVTGNAGLETYIKGVDGRVSGFVSKIQGFTTTDNVKVVFNDCVNYANIEHTGTSNEGASGGFGGRFVNCNVTLNNCDNYGYVKSNRGTTWWQGIGGLVGEVNRSAFITINGSNNYGEVYCAHSVAGGLLGAVTNSSDAVINDSANYGKVWNGNAWNMAAGGIVGGATKKEGYTSADNNAITIKISNTVNYGLVFSYNANVGGFMGMTNSRDEVALIEITDSANYGKIDTNGSNAAGFLGQTGAQTTKVINCVNYGDVETRGSNGAAGIISHFWSGNNKDLVVEGCVNYGRIYSKGGRAAGITIQLNTDNSAVIKNNANYGTVIAATEANGIANFAECGKLEFVGNANYGLLVGTKGTDAPLYGKISEGATNDKNYAGGVVVKNADVAAVVKGLASPYNYAANGVGKDAWNAVVKAVAAAENYTIPEEKPAYVETVIDFTKLTYKAYATKDQKVDNATGTVKDPVAVPEYAKLAEHYKMNITANAIDAQQIGDAGRLFYIPTETLAINANTYYEYYVNAKNNRNTGYAGMVYAMANGVPYFVYGALNNNSDLGADVCELRASVGAQDIELFGALHIDSFAQDLTSDGFGQFKVVYDGYNVSIYSLSGGEWVKVVFEKDGVKNDTITLPEGAVVTPGALFCRDGNAGKQRSITLKDAKVLAAPAVAVVAEAAPALTLEQAIAALVDYTALNNAKVELAAMGDVAEDDAKAVALKTAIAAMEAAKSQADVDKAAADYAAAVEAYVDLSMLNYQLAQAAKLNRYTFTAGSWADLEAALAAAKVVDLKNQEAVNAAAAAIDAAIYGLADISEISDMIQKAIAKAEALVEADYTPASFAKIAAPLAAAKAALESGESELMEAAEMELKAALNALVNVKEVVELLAELTALEAAKYSTASYAYVKTAILLGETALTATTNDYVAVAVKALTAAKAGLVDLTALKDAIADAEGVDASKYTAASYNALVAVIAEAKLAYVSATTAKEVEDAAAAVAAAKKALKRAVAINTADLAALIAEVEALDVTKYTVATWDAVKTALAAAKIAMYADVQKDVNAAKDALAAAKAALTEKPVINTADLEALLAEVAELDFVKYTTETWDALKLAIATAKVALVSEDQAAVDAAKDALAAAKAALAEKPAVVPEDKPEATEPEATEPEATEPEATEPEATEPAPAEEGCGSAIAATVVVMTAVLGLGATVVLKKKED